MPDRDLPDAAESGSRDPRRPPRSETSLESHTSVEKDFRRVCPNCGALLVDISCKSRCSRCHFFSDCSDPW